MKKILLSLLIVILLSGCAQLNLDIPSSSNNNEDSTPFTSNGDMIVAHFIDVGQGDANFIELPTGEVMLIDAGTSGYGDDIIEYIQNLGYTDIDDIKYVQKYDLIQTIIDYDYAEKINNVKLEKKLKVHVKINTGMNRIGESYTNIGKLIKIYQMDNLEILGTFTHLCSSDSLDESDIEFTKKQIENFYKCTENIKSLGYDIGKIHIQASYGILNYPELKCDYVRPGIIMYGAFSSKNDKTKINIDLKPALSLKARVTSVKQIDAGQTVSYGRTFKANKTMKIATVSIGYADGYPRNLSNKQAEVLVNNEYATIIGRICMDQLVIDVTNITNVKQGDIVTLIGDEPEISVENIAELSGTITNEILCRIGARIERF